MRMGIKEPELPLFFHSDRCPDYAKTEAPGHQAGRPWKADSDCHKLAIAFAEGKTFTEMEAIDFIGSSAGGRRLREVRKTMAENGVTLKSIWVDAEPRYKRHGLEVEDRVRWFNLLIKWNTK